MEEREIMSQLGKEEVVRAFNDFMNEPGSGFPVDYGYTLKTFARGYMEGLLKAKTTAENCGGGDCDDAADAIKRISQELFP